MSGRDECQREKQNMVMGLVEQDRAKGLGFYMG